MTEMRTRMERFQGYAEALAANGQLYKAIPIDHNKPSINELTEYFKFKFNPAKRTLIFVQNQWALPRVYKALQPMAHLLPQQIGLWDSTAKTGLISPHRPSPPSSSPSTKKVAKQPRCCSPYLTEAANPASSAFSNASSIGSAPPQSKLWDTPIGGTALGSISLPTSTAT